VYAEYGDVVAKPRLAARLRRSRYAITGSRVGFVGPLEVLLPIAGDGYISVSGDTYWHDTYWKPEHYWDCRTRCGATF
jgi:hypothetical protein